MSPRSAVRAHRRAPTSGGAEGKGTTAKKLIEAMYECQILTTEFLLKFDDLAIGTVTAPDAARAGYGGAKG